MTYSIVARDPETGELGVAVASRWPAAGAVVPWLESGVGAVATQAFTNVALGPLALAAMRDGAGAVQALRDVLATDSDREVRQLGLVDAAGRTAAHTGRACVEWAGHHNDADVSVQGNMLERESACSRMYDAFSAATGDLAERLLAALSAGERAGGDLRGSQSAALLVAPGGPGVAPWMRRFDLRVDDAPDPLEKLTRLLRVARAFEGLDEAFSAAQAGAAEDGLRGTAAAYELAPEDPQIAFWHGVLLLASGREDAGRALLVSTLREEPRLAAFATRSAAAEPGSALAATLRQVAESAPEPR